jgi:hypothetical protein
MAGDRKRCVPAMSFFSPQGLTSTWTVDVHVKKFAIFRSKPYGPIRRLASKAKRLLLGLFS